MGNQISIKLRQIADEIEKQSEIIPEKSGETLQLMHEIYIRPLLECRIIKNVDVAKMLHISPTTVSTLIQMGKLSTTVDGKITEYHLWKYLSNEKNKELK